MCNIDYTIEIISQDLKERVGIMGENIQGLVGNLVHIVVRGFDGVEERLSGILGHNGRGYYVRTQENLLELNTKDIVEVFTLLRMKN